MAEMALVRYGGARGLAGGLFGAGGALFAAFVASYVVWQQLAFERDRFNLAERRREALETYSFERVIEYYSRLLKSFDAAAGGADVVYVNGLDQLSKTGNLVAFFGSLPDDHRSLARDAWERLSNLNIALIQLRERNQASLAPDLKSGAEINAGIGEVVASMRRFCDLAQTELERRRA